MYFYAVSSCLFLFLLQEVLGLHDQSVLLPQILAVITGASLTTVFFIGLVPTVIHAVTMKILRQALGDVPTGEIAKGALDLLSTPMRNCGEESGDKFNMKALQKSGPPIVYNHLIFSPWCYPPCGILPLLSRTIFHEPPLQ